MRRAHLTGGYPHHLEQRFRGARLGDPWKWHFVAHHLAHAVSAFHASPFEEAAVMTLDGRGERATTTYATGSRSALRMIGQVEFPHSLGLLYEKVTEYLGFLHSSDEYKVMALASYGQPRYLDEFREIIRLGDRGSYLLDDPLLEERFGPARQRNTCFEQKHFDIARSLQAALEETVVALARWLHDETGSENLAMAGGVALNCVMNSRIRDAGIFRDIWVQPAAGDAGTALGAALWVDSKERGSPDRVWKMDHAYLGPEYSDEAIQHFLDWSKTPYRRMDDIAGETAALLAAGRIAGWFQGRMEFGPRALGARSIIASPADPSMKDRMNQIKDREDFRPVAPAVLEEEAANWFAGARPSPFMLFVNEVLPEVAGRIPAVRHIDSTARVQTVSHRHNPRFHDLIRCFRDRTGIPIVINTSFNTRGEPIVESPRDAVESFWTTPLDALAIGSFLLEKRR